SLSLLVVLPALVSAQEKKSKTVQPIAVVELKRTTPVLYDKDIEPILVNKCTFCHADNIKEGKLDMGTYESLMKGGKRGVPIMPGKSADSLLVKVAGKTQKPAMPPKSEEPLTPEELALIKLWIDQGAKAPSMKRERPKVIVTGPPAGVHPVLGVAVSPDKAKVAASRGNQIHIYEAASGKLLSTFVDPQLVGPDKKPVKAAHLSLVESLVYSPDGKTLASGAFQEVILWDAQSGAVRQRLTGFADRVVALDFSHDSKLLATGGGAPTADGEIKIYDAASGKLVVEIKNGHSDTVFGVSFGPDDKKLATCAADKFVKTFEVPSGKLLKSFEGHTHHVLGVDWKADGKLLASAGADNVVKIWDFEKGEQVRTIPGHGKQVTRLLFVGKTDQVATCSGDQTVRFWNVSNGGNVRNFAGSADFLYALSVSPDGAVVAAGGQEGIVRLYNGTNGQFLKSLLPPDAEPAAPKKK
ncbi:MAG TPA: c-type cytochrome domain-containing protein, partial [Gemmataceae bacterium]|nr:c-type cytochrome domain-containing protein [Gemmataceae bacterium]